MARSAVAESVELAHLLATAGVRTVAATPHVRDDYPNDAASIGEALGTLRDALEEAAIPLEVVGGAELAFEQLDRTTEELRRFSFGVSSILLVETPYFGWPLALESRLFDFGWPASPSYWPIPSAIRTCRPTWRWWSTSSARTCSCK